MNELTSEEYLAIEKFAYNLKECFSSKKESFKDPLSSVMLDYAIKIIDLHLDLKRLELEQYALNQEKALLKGDKN